MDSTIYTLNVIISTYSIIIAVLGTLGSISSFFICTRKNLRSIPTFVFMSFMVVTDMMSLYSWNLNNFLITFFGLSIGDFSEASCKITSFIQFFCNQSSAYFLLAIACERYLSVRIVNWRTYYFKQKQAIITAFVILSIIFSINSHTLATLYLPEKINENSTSLGLCYSTTMYKTWRLFHTYVYSIVPFFCLVIVNSLLLQQVIYSKNHRTIVPASIARTEKNKSMSKTVMIMTITFILLTGPLAVIGGYFLYMIKTDSERVILYSIAAFAHTYHASNFLIAMLSNKKFLNEFKSLYKKDQEISDPARDTSSRTKNKNKNNKQ